MYIWNRLKSVKQHFANVGVMERPAVHRMQKLVEMLGDEEMVARYADRLTEKAQYVINGGGEQYQEYEQKDLSPFAGAGYHGSTKIGRAYSKSILPYLPSKILNTLYKESHLDLDIRCSYSTMLLKAFGDLDLEFFPAYIEDPEAVYEAMGITRWRAKKLVNTIICSAPNVSEDPEAGNWAELSRNPVIVKIKSDVDKMCVALRERYPEFLEMIRIKCMAEDKRSHVEGTALGYLAADMEHSVMRKAIKFIFPEDSVLQNVVWKYDGILIPKSSMVGVRQNQFISDLKAHILTSMDINVNFKIGDLGESFGMVLSPDDIAQEAEDPYKRWKRYFEKKWARLEDPPCFMMFGRNGKKWADMNKSNFEHNTMEQPKEFVKRWLEDPEKRHYHSREFCPPPLEIEDGVYNLFRGFAAAELPTNEGPVDLERYFNHVRLICGNSDVNASYLHKLLALKFQQPGLKWRVMPIVISAQGVGKDILFDFWWSLFGKELCIKDNGIHKFADSNSHVLEGKLLVCLQEMGYKDIKDYEEDLKAMITNETLIVKKKYFNSFAIRNSFDMIGFTNQVGAVNVPPDDRRFFILEADSTYAQDKNYIMPLLAFFHSTVNQRAVYDYYMNLDISGFDPSADRPITEAHKEMVANSLSFGDRFLKMYLSIAIQNAANQDRSTNPRYWDYNMIGKTLRVRTSLINDAFLEYAASNHINNHQNKNSMAQFFSKQMRELNLRTDKYKTAGHDHLMQSKRLGGGLRYWDIDVEGLKAYLEHVFNEDAIVEEEDPTPARSAIPRRSLHRAAPGEPTKFVIKENGEAVFGTDDIEEANKELGEAYVVTRFDEVQGKHVQFLIHQHRNNMEISLGTEYMGEGGKARLEAKYPFYIRDRTL
jgi:hypothetical protein